MSQAYLHIRPTLSHISRERVYMEMLFWMFVGLVILGRIEYSEYNSRKREENSTLHKDTDTKKDNDTWLI